MIGILRAMVFTRIRDIERIIDCAATLADRYQCDSAMDALNDAYIAKVHGNYKMAGVLTIRALNAIDKAR